MELKKVLIVDDDLASRLLLQKALKNENFELTTSKSGAEALDVLAKKPFDLVITDLVMEGISGLELLQKVKQIDSHIAVILLTGHASIETAIEAIRLGASDYLLKPINTEELRVRIQRAFERQELERRLQEAERRLTYNATIATANHEINQPLTVIISAIDMVKMELEKMGITNERLENYLELMNKSSQRIANILRKLREITSPKIQDVPLGMKMIDLEMESEEAVLDFGKYILIVEDEENLRQIMREVLETAGFKVILAETAREGLELFKMNHSLIEMIILDFNLPDASGLEVLKKLMKIDSSVKVLLTSGFDVDDSIEEALEMGALQFLRKPFNRQQILDVVGKLYSYHPAISTKLK